jgi:hypothetical protein
MYAFYTSDAPQEAIEKGRMSLRAFYSVPLVQIKYGQSNTGNRPPAQLRSYTDKLSPSLGTLETKGYNGLQLSGKSWRTARKRRKSWRSSSCSSTAPYSPTHLQPKIHISICIYISNCVSF